MARLGLILCTLYFSLLCTFFNRKRETIDKGHCQPSSAKMGINMEKIGYEPQRGRLFVEEH